MTPAASELPQPETARERPVLLTLAGIQFTFILGFMMMMPLGPQFIRDLHLTTQQFSLLLASYTFVAAASNLLAATYIDRFDRRTLMLCLYVLFLMATLACGLAPDYPTLLAARAFAGATGGLLGAMVQLFVASLIPFERRGKAMGIVMAAISVSAVIGVPLALFLANRFPTLSWRAPFFFPPA
jgi:predicted MFS family arabinose efflux permease